MNIQHAGYPYWYGNTCNMHTADNHQHYSPVNMTDKASVTSYIAGVFTAMWGVLTFEHIIGIAGIVIGLTGLAVNTYYKHKQDKREHERHIRYMRSHDNADKF